MQVLGIVPSPSLPLVPITEVSGPGNVLYACRPCFACHVAHILN